MYCSLVDAFPIREKKSMISCWQPDKETEKKPEMKGALAHRDQDQKQVQSLSCPQAMTEQAMTVSPCVMNLHHCLLCPYCRNFLSTFFQVKEQKRKSRRHSARDKRRNSDRYSDRDNHQRRRYIPTRMGSSVEFDETIMRIDVTWTTLLVILAGSTFFLLLWRVLGERK